MSWSWWNDDSFVPYSAEASGVLEAAYMDDGELARVTLHTDWGKYVVKHTKAKGWIQHRAANPGLWRVVERRAASTAASHAGEEESVSEGQEASALLRGQRRTALGTGAVPEAALPQVAGSGSGQRADVGAMAVVEGAVAASAPVEPPTGELTEDELLAVKTAEAGFATLANEEAGGKQVGNRRAGGVADGNSQQVDTGAGENDSSTEDDDWEARADWEPRAASDSARPPKSQVTSDEASASDEKVGDDTRPLYPSRSPTLVCHR